jgi:hypothetical protein
MGDYNAAHETLDDAKADVKDYVETVIDSAWTADEDIEDDIGYQPGAVYVDFPSGQGAEYIEVSDPCYEPDCWDDDGDLRQE